MVQRQIKKTLKIIVGSLFLFLGIIGLFLPVLQGILFIFIGLGILSTEITLIKKTLIRLEERFPKQAEHFRRIKHRVRRREKS